VGDCYDFSIVRWDESQKGYVVDRSLDPELQEPAPHTAKA
jgi:hypothetical protein